MPAHHAPRRRAFRPSQLFRAAAVLLILAGSAAQAALLTLSYSGSSAGSLDGTAFALSDFTITAIADTDDVVTTTLPTATLYAVAHQSARISIAGLGVFDFLGATRSFFRDNISQPDLVGFARGAPDNTDLFTLGGLTTLSGWDLSSDLAPTTSYGALQQWGFAPAVVTTGGILVFPSVLLNSTSVSAQVTSVPLPATLPLMGLGLGLCLAVPRRRQR